MAGEVSASTKYRRRKRKLMAARFAIGDKSSRRLVIQNARLYADVTESEVISSSVSPLHDIKVPKDRHGDSRISRPPLKPEEDGPRRKQNENHLQNYTGEEGSTSHKPSAEEQLCSPCAPALSLAHSMLEYTANSCGGEENDVLTSSASTSDGNSICGDSDSIDSDFEVHYLEEEPEEHLGNDNNQENEEDNAVANERAQQDVNVDMVDNHHDSDPDEPSDSDSNSDSSSEDDSDDEPLFNFDRVERLNRRLHLNRNRSVRESLLMFIAVSCANNWTYKSLIDTLKAENTLLGQVLFPTCSKGLWRVLSFERQGMTKFAYCQGCGRYLGHYNNLNDGDEVECRGCGLTLPKCKLKWFISVSIRKQLMHLVSIPEMRQHLQYRNNRVKLNPDALEDIFDGSAFRDLQRDNGPLSSDFNFSYVIETDGLRLGKSPKAEAWTLLLRIVDLPPKLRQKHMLLAGVWIDNKPVTPTMNTFLRPFIKQANRLSQEGFVWRGNDGVERRSLFVPLCLNVDYKARFPILNMVQYNSHYGCFICDNRGVWLNNCARYSSLPHHDVPAPQLRTDASIREDMEAAHVGGDTVRGFRGISALLLLENYSIAAGNAIDNLHAVFLRAAPAHTEQLLRSGDLPVATKLRRINQRFLNARPPSKFSRVPYDFHKRASYRASEWRNWVLHYSVPCLQDLGIPQNKLDHWQMLCHGVFLLSQDSISLQDIDTAERLLQQYAQLYEQYYGLDHITPCIHLMTHLAHVVRLWGPLNCYSMFFFESYNQKVLSKTTSPNGAIYQIVTRHLLRQQVMCSMHRQEGLPEDIREFIVKVMSKDRHINCTEVDGVYLLGDGNVRPPNNQEIQCLELEGFQCDNLREFDRVIIGSCQYQSRRLNRQTQHDNTNIYTKQNTFCIVNSIVVISHPDHEDFCGMFVTELDVIPFQVARHISRVRQGHNLPHFIRIGQVLCPAVKHEVLGETFVSPLPTVCDID